MKNSCLLAFFCLMFWQNSFGQNLNWSHEKQLDSLIFSQKFKPENPGFSVIVVENGHVVYEKQNGLANLEKHLTISPETMFNIGSITKQFTAACIFLLEEQGKLRRSDPIQKYLPELPDFGQPILIDHLIGHTSGIPDHFEVLDLQNKKGSKYLSPEKVIEILRRAPVLSFPPGSDFAYCNTGYMLLSMVVERVSGLAVHDFATKNIFQPLGMAHSNYFQSEKNGLPDGTTSYDYQPKKGKFKHRKPIGNATGATGVQATLRDFVRWDQNFYKNKLGAGIQNLIEKMETPYFLNDGTTTNYGGGLFLKKYRGLKMVSHTGGWNSFLMDYRQFPDSKIAVLVASNNDFSSPFSIADSICNLILEFPAAQKFEPNLTGLKFPAEKLAGVFLSDNNFVRRVKFEKGILSVSDFREKEMRLTDPKIAGDSLVLFLDERGDPVYFRLDSSKNVLGFSWEGGHFFRVNRFYKKLGTPAAAAETKNFCGKYKSKTWKQTLKIKQNRRTGELKLRPFFFVNYHLQAIGDSEFLVKGEKVVLRFSENGLVLGNDWVSNLRMKKVK